MRLVGYIKQTKENSFRIPVYSNQENDYYFHHLDDTYAITSFSKTDLNTISFQKVYLSKKFDIGSKAALIFVGMDGYIKYDDAENAIEEIINYLNDTTTENTDYESILNEALDLKSKIISDNYIINNFEVDINQKKEQFILTFDFPSPKKANTITSTKSDEVSSTTSNKTDLKPVKQDYQINPTYTPIYEYLTRVGMNIEVTLKLRANERRSTLKKSNYQFKITKKKNRD
jgi:hypothetical protein